MYITFLVNYSIDYKTRKYLKEKKVKKITANLKKNILLHSDKQKLHLSVI